MTTAGRTSHPRTAAVVEPDDGPEWAAARELLRDGTLAIRADAPACPLVEAWLPRILVRSPAPATVRAWIGVRAGRPEFAAPSGPHALDLRGVLGWVPGDGTILLHGPGGGVSASIDLPARRAEVRVDPEVRTEEEVGLEVFAALTLASAFLLGRMERSLIHAAGIVAPDGRGWLLVGGTFSGKSTTCVNLIRAGWDYLADDHVILGRDAAGALNVEGWPRRFNLDVGYHDGASQGVRTRVDPGAFGPGRWCPTVPLAGLLFPRVEAASSTELLEIHPAGALGRLLQQSPWLLADGAAAPAVLALLGDAARAPAHALRLGGDTYRDPGRLAALLREGLARHAQ